jgi:predicted nucleic acid-binding protein
LAASRRYYIDTNVVIAIVEASSALTPNQLNFLKDVDGGGAEAATSELTLAECLVKPIADRNEAAVKAYLSFLDGRPRFPLVPFHREILLAAAQLRATTGVKLPDAIHMATAEHSSCDAVLTNDTRFGRSSRVPVVIWSQL